MRRLLGGMLLALSTTWVAACENAGADRVVGVTATGAVVGVVYFDGNATRQEEQGETRLAGVRVGLVVAGTASATVSALSNAQGTFAAGGVPVGDYRVVVDNTTIGDTATVVEIDDADINVRPGDTVTVRVAISFPLVTVAEAVALPLGARVFVDGIALNERSTFGDSTIHVADTSGTLRTVRTGPSPVFPGDSIRLRGAISTRAGRVVVDLDRRSPSILAIAEIPVLDTVTTATAAAADGGQLDAALVVIDSARIADTTTSDQGRVLTINDGSGPLEVLLDQHIAFSPALFMVPGADLRVLGLLVPSVSGGWQLKPRSDADIAVTAPVVPVAVARSSSVGVLVFVDGIALTSDAGFADSTLHIADTSGTVRATRVRHANVLPGDSVRLIGAVALRNGQPVIDQAQPFVLAVSRIPPVPRVMSATATTAGGGVWDAALVRLLNATIVDTATVGGDFVLTVDDGSGALEIVLDQDVGFFLTPLDPGVVIDVNGVLVPTGSGSWQLKPRVGADVTVK